MRSRRRLVYLLLTLLPFFLASAGQNSKSRLPATSSASKFSFARYWNGCGPTDEPQSGITLTPVFVKCGKIGSLTAPPYINIQFFDAGAASAPIAVVWVSGKKAAKAMRCLTEHAACDAAISGVIDFGDSQPHNHRPQTYELKFADGSVEKGTFTSHPPCGKVTCW